MSREYPDRPIVGVGVVVWREDKFLLIQRGKPPRRGQWSLPGGMHELGETTREAAAREVMEETNLEVDIKELLDVIDTISLDDNDAVRVQYVLVDYWAEWVSGEAVAGSDAMGVGWFTLDQLPELGMWSETNRVIEMSAKRR